MLPAKRKAMPHFHKYLCLLVAAAMPSCFYAQSATGYSAHLRQKEAGKGTVTIYQSKEIEHLVDNTRKAAEVKAETKSSTHTTAEHSGKTPATAKEHHTEASQPTAATHKRYNERARHKVQGFRICIFTGGNSRKDKEKAYQMAKLCSAKFSELATYPTFITPRWVTYVGDFRTREQAQKYVTLIRKARFTYEVRIVRSEVNVPL